MFYPLHVGNMWQHVRPSHVGGYSYNDTVMTRITGTAMFDGRTYAVVETSPSQGSTSPSVYYARFDYAAGNYYERVSASKPEVLKDSLGTNIPGTYSWGTLSIAYHQSLFGLDATVRKIEKTGDYPSGYYAAAGIGVHNSYGTGWRTSFSSTLVYAKIDGNEYGSMIGNTAWRIQQSGVQVKLLAVAHLDANSLIAVGRDGVVLRTTDGGAIWAMQVSGTPNHLQGLCFVDASVGTAVGSSGTILRTSDGGITWTAQSSGTSEWLWSVSFVDRTTGTIVGGSGTILRTTNGGSTWTSQSGVTDQNLTGVSFINTQVQIAVGSNGTILRTTNGGSSWSKQSNGIDTTKRLSGLSFTDASTGTVVGDWGKIYRTTDGGETWTSQPSGTVTFLWGGSFSNASTGIAVGYGGTILLTTNGGTYWTRQSINSTSELFAVSSFDPGTATVVGEVGTILRFTRNPTSVTETAIPLQLRLDQNYPNPFNPVTNIRYGVGVVSGQWHALSEVEWSVASRVRLALYDLLGREVAVLVDERKAPGTYEVQFDGSRLASGVYFYRMQAGNFAQTRKLLLLR
jgi:photosystem II stability/assembly factor-like uncharacterized protein